MILFVLTPDKEHQKPRKPVHTLLSIATAGWRDVMEKLPLGCHEVSYAWKRNFWKNLLAVILGWVSRSPTSGQIL